MQKLLEAILDNHHLVRRPRTASVSSGAELEWLASAQACTGPPINAIVVSQDLSEVIDQGDQRIISACESLEHPAYAQGSRTLAVQYSEAGLTPALRRLLLHARRVDLVDPYLDPQVETCYGFLILVSRLIHESGKSAKLRLHLSMEKQLTSHGSEECLRILTACDERLRELSCKYRLTIDRLAWSEEPGSVYKLHNRYLLTEQFGIQAGMSFRCEDQDSAKLDRWQLLDHAASEDIRREYADESRCYCNFHTQRFSWRSSNS